MILSYNRLVKLVKQGCIDAPISAINGSSIDLTMNNTVFVEYNCESLILPSIENTNPIMFERSLEFSPYILKPKEFILASTVEKFNLPNNISASYRLNSTLARRGLNHSLSDWCDPGWKDVVLTLEFFNNLNYHNILIKNRMRCGQVIFYEHEEVPEKNSYKKLGRYNHLINISQGL